jgi:hypothetical protein
MLRQSSWRGWKNRPWILRLCSSVKFKTWTDANCAVTSMLSAAASRANRIPSPDRSVATKTSERFGPSSPESSQSVDPPWSSSRTLQPSLLEEDFDLSERNYADWVSMSLTRSSLAREILAHRIYASASSYWPTATSMDQKSSGVSANRTPESGRHSGTTLTDATRDWPTPRTITGGAETAEREQELGRTRSGGGDLQAASLMWQTPEDSTGGNVSRSGDRKGELLLAGQAGAWAKNLYPTPSATRYGLSQNEGEVPHERPSAGTPSLESWASSLPAQMTKKSGTASLKQHLTSHPRLNPSFVSWLMGYPWYWMRAEPINSAALETQLWLRRLMSHFGNLWNG